MGAPDQVAPGARSVQYICFGLVLCDSGIAGVIDTRRIRQCWRNLRITQYLGWVRAKSTATPRQRNSSREQQQGKNERKKTSTDKLISTEIEGSVSKQRFTAFEKIPELQQGRHGIQQSLAGRQTISSTPSNQ